MSKSTQTVLLCGLLVALAPAGAASRAEETVGSLKIVSGEPRLIVVNGYSTSFHWPSVLQRKLDKHLDGNRVVEVLSATKGGTPIAKWMDAQTGKRLAPWTDILRPALNRADGRPVVVLAQQSLQWAFGDRAAGIRNVEDRERIADGADVLERYTDSLLEDGADEVFVAMHIYKTGMEPVIGNEQFALTEFLKGKPAHVHAGPDVWQPMKAQWPQAFAADKVHPNSVGAEIMAQYWFEAILKYDEAEVPEWSRQEMVVAMKKGPTQVAGGESSRGSGSRQPGRGRSQGRFEGGRNMSFKGIAARHDRNKDGKITRQEFRAPQQVFQRLDRNRDGVLTKDDFEDSNSGAARPTDRSTPGLKRSSSRDGKLGQ